MHKFFTARLDALDTHGNRAARLSPSWIILRSNALSTSNPRQGRSASKESMTGKTFSTNVRLARHAATRLQKTFHAYDACHGYQFNDCFIPNGDDDIDVSDGQ
ncbi:hypothetical protein GOP47_0008244 [Adiantum capillus-veneris]|uniref:Uncharacterized protein n=1 Tax=Adiantum capillus-veneris TaxID=13818 RepID=A0A9D4ZI02_ADICA|nr:hypothetical protein GOP47_0008244 [Adiantum capillus-veneris]